MKIVHKACPCVLRTGRGRAEILVFRHPLAGIQVPKGTVEDAEAIDDAVLRELREETGVTCARIESKIGEFDRHVGAGEDEGGELERHVWHVYHVSTDEERPRWTHRPTGGGVESKFEFECFWHRLGDSDPGFHPVFRRVLDLCLQYMVEGSSSHHGTVGT
ncbi:MAG: NUDIX domain-containing protein [Candidatus Eisenbacteria bacterium]